MEVFLESDDYLIFAKDIAFYSDKSSIRTISLNNSLSSEPGEMFTSYYKGSVNPCGQELSVDEVGCLTHTRRAMQMYVDVFVMNNYVKNIAEFIVAFVIMYFLS